MTMGPLSTVAVYGAHHLVFVSWCITRYRSLVLFSILKYIVRLKHFNTIIILRENSDTPDNFLCRKLELTN